MRRHGSILPAGRHAAARALIQPIAHRGLHKADSGIIENTRAAFSAAIAKGYGIECDLQPADDGSPVVFHDDTLDRLTTAKGLVRTKNIRELSQIAFKSTSDRILTLGSDYCFNSASNGI